MRSQKGLCIARDQERLGEMAKAVQSSRTEVFDGRGRVRSWGQGTCRGDHCGCHGGASFVHSTEVPSGGPWTHFRASGSNMHRPHSMDVKSSGEKGHKAH